MAGVCKACQPVKVILLSCGSFNPVTHMHLRLFEIARDALHSTGLFKVLEGVISPVNDAYEKKGLLSSKHRLAMCKLAVKTSDWISVNDWEATQDGWSKTADLLDYMTDKYSKKYSENVKVKLLCGGDLLESFAVPDLWSDEHIKKIVSENGIVVISRQGSNPEQFIYNSDVLTKNKNNIHIVTEWITNDISATKIRTALCRHESVKYLLPDTVIEYIITNQLYGSRQM